METVANSSTEITVNWQAEQLSGEISNATGYIIFYKAEGSSSYQQVATSPDAVTMSLKELKKFTQYRIVVSPYNASGNGVPSEPVNDTTFEDGKRKLVHYYKSCILIGWATHYLFVIDH